MVDNKRLYVLYHYRYLKEYKENLLDQNDEVAYYVLRIHSDSMIIDEQDLSKSFHKMFSKKNSKSELLGPFDELHEMNQFVVEVLKKNDLEEALLMSVHDFNMGIESINNIGDFSTIFEEYGRKLRIEGSPKAKYSWF